MMAGTDTGKAGLLSGWISRNDLALELDVESGTLARWASDGTGPKQIRIGRRVMYRRAAVQHWLEKMENGE